MIRKTTVLEKLALVACGVILFAAALFNPIGCKSDGTFEGVAPTQDIKNLGQDIGNTGRDLNDTTKTIKTNATEGAAKTPAAAQPVLYPYWANILSAVGVQEQLVKNLDEMKKRAEIAEAKSVEFEGNFKTEQDKRKAAEDNTTKELRHKYLAYSGILFMASLVLFGIAIWSGGNKLLLWGATLAGVGSAVCIFIVQTVALIPWIVGGAAIVAVAMLVYTLWAKSKKINVLDTATKELVETVEATKPRMTTLGRARVFGDGPGKGDAFAIQSKETEALVKQIRESIEKAPKLPATVAVDYNGDGVIDERDVPPTELVSPNSPLSMPRKKPFVLR